MNRPTALTVRAARADIVHDALLANPRALALEDVPHLERVAAWNPAVLANALDDLQADGRITIDGVGWITVRDHGATT